MKCAYFADASLVMMHFILRTMFVYEREMERCVMVHPFHRRITHAVFIDTPFYTTSIFKSSEKQHSKSKRSISMIEDASTACLTKMANSDSPLFLHE